MIHGKITGDVNKNAETQRKSHLKIKRLWCIIYLEVIGIESPIALSKNGYKE